MPDSSRATVDVMATMETCVAGDVDARFRDAEVSSGAGYNVPIIVPRLFMNESPGPETRKNPAARHHMVGSVKKRWVSELSSIVFFRASASVCRFRSSSFSIV